MRLDDADRENIAQLLAEALLADLTALTKGATSPGSDPNAHKPAEALRDAVA